MSHANFDNKLYPFATSTLNRGGVAMHYVDDGPRMASPVLMVHGNPTWSFYWRNLIAKLRGTHRTVAPDHIGCGWSDKPPERDYDYTLRSRIDDLTALVDTLDLRNVTLVVHDWGGAIGMGWAVEHAARVAKLVVLNTAAFGLPRGKSFPAVLRLARLPMVGSALVRGANAFVRGTTRWCVTRKPLSAAVAAGYRAPYRSWSDRVAIHRFVTDIPLHPRDRAFAPLRAIENGLANLQDKPMFIGWGMRDFVFDRHFLAEWERRFPHAVVKRFEDCGHLVLEDAGDALIDAIVEFVQPNAQQVAQP